MNSCNNTFNDTCAHVTAVDKAYKYTTSKELPSTWKREEILGPHEQVKKSNTSPLTSTTTAATTSVSTAMEDSCDDSSSVSIIYI